MVGDNNIIRIGSSQTATYLAGKIYGNGAGLTGVGQTVPGTGSYNTAIGLSALGVNTSGYYNSAFGAFALDKNTTGYDNVAVGIDALDHNTTGYNNTAVGFNALVFGNGNNDTATGYNSIGGNSVTGVGNTADGGYTLYELSSGYNNTAVGYTALEANTTAQDNVGIGVNSLWKNSTGGFNTAVGTYSLQAATTAVSNVAVGLDALYSMTTGTGNIAIGNLAGVNLTSGMNDIYIGNNGGGFAESNTIRIGSSQTQTFIAGNTAINGGLNVDDAGLNVGTLVDALTFGISSGEGIASDRNNASTSPYDVELWTDYAERLKVAQNGYVGIGTDNPQQQLEVNGEYLEVDGYTPVDAYIGDDGGGNDVQIGSLLSGVTNVACFNVADQKYMNLYCAAITITGGADLAEPFKIAKARQPIVPGDVVVIDDTNPGQLKLTDRPYDGRVAGVVSGGNGIHPGIQMQQQGLLDGGKNVALTGRVYVQADTENGPIHPGDLLTTSSTPGRAMKVTDHGRAQGAILGKAMSSLDDGSGMVLVLVTLQ